MSERAAVKPAPKRGRWPELVTLRDGSGIAIRPIRKNDKRRLREGFERLSPESRYRRFLVPMPTLSARLVRYFTEVDHHDHEALVAVGADTGEPIGVARYVRSEDDAEAAEVAVAVVDDWQGRGVATQLLGRLAQRAHEEGITRFTATCLAGNREVLDLFSELGRTQILPSDSGLVEAHIELPAVDEGRLREVLRAAATRRLLFRPPSREDLS
jgi:RimJ/RimL family protein N-acetyltransferase